MPGIFKLALIIPFALGNPHHAGFFMAPLAILGAVAWLRLPSERARTLKLVVILFLATACPVLIDVAYGYFFAPRQVLGGIFPFLVFCALGVHFLTLRIAALRLRQLVWALIGLATLIVPWSLSVLLKEPPVTDQPMHRFREIAQELVQTNARSVFMLDPCNLGTLVHYLDRAKKIGSQTRADANIEGIAIHRICWKDGLCLSAPVDLKYCWMKEETLAQDPITRVLASRSLNADQVIYELERLPNLPELANIRQVRAW
jgi:hypothetical protein